MTICLPDIDGIEYTLPRELLPGECHERFSFEFPRERRPRWLGGQFYFQKESFLLDMDDRRARFEQARTLPPGSEITAYPSVHAHLAGIAHPIHDTKVYLPTSWITYGAFSRETGICYGIEGVCHTPSGDGYVEFQLTGEFRVEDFADRLAQLLTGTTSDNFSYP